MADDELLLSGGIDLDDAEDLVEEIEGIEDDEAAKASELDAKQSADPLQMLFKHHPECKIYYAEAITPKLVLLAAPPDHPTREGAPDEQHRSQPWLSQYERTKILGFRTNQLAQGAKPYIAVPKHVVATIEIARIELKERRLPFIVARVMPDGNFEFWRLSDLMIL